MDHRHHIIVVEDEVTQRDLLVDYLSRQNFRVSGVEDGSGLRDLVERDPPALVLLDLRLRGEDGLTLARWLRENFSVGIIMLTGRHEIVDHILGLEMGADYYVPKPYHPRQLLAAVRSVLRRTPTQTTEKQTPSRSKARFAGWNLDLASRELFSPSGEEVPLTTGAFDLLAAFVNNANQVLTRGRLLDLARNREGGPKDRTIDVQVGRLRRKLKDDPKKATMIKTVRPSGYIFTPELEWL